MENYLIAMAVSAGIFALMALGLNVIWGMAGMINLGLVGFFAVGAYVSALLTLKLHLPIVAADRYFSRTRGDAGRNLCHGGCMRPARLLLSRPAATTTMAAILTALAVHAAG